jgi:hypothetical protein
MLEEARIHQIIMFYTNKIKNYVIKAKKRVHNYLVHFIIPTKFNKNLKYFSSSPPVSSELLSSAVQLLMKKNSWGP